MNSRVIGQQPKLLSASFRQQLITMPVRFARGLATKSGKAGKGKGGAMKLGNMKIKMTNDPPGAKPGEREEAAAEMEEARQEHEKQEEHTNRFGQLPHQRPWHYHVFILAGCALGAGWIGDIFGLTAGIGAPGMIEQFDEYMILVYEEKETDKLEKALKNIANFTMENDTLKRMVISSEQDMARIIELSGRLDMPYNVRNLATKILDNVTLLGENHAVALQRGYHRHLIKLIEAPESALLLIKTASFALCNLCDREESRPQLLEDGVLKALDKVLSDDKTFRQRALGTMGRLCAAAEDNKSSMTKLTKHEWKLVTKYAKETAALNDSTLMGLKATLVESGLILYVHTVVGGGVWGLAYSLKQKAPAKVMMRNILRTAFITGVIPAYFVGASVSIFNHYKNQTDTSVQVSRLYGAAAFMTAYPWSYLLPILDRWSPLWLGGHVVGFASFFAYMIISDHDLLKTDEQLKLEDKNRAEKAQAAGAK